MLKAIYRVSAAIALEQAQVGYDPVWKILLERGCMPHDRLPVLRRAFRHRLVGGMFLDLVGHGVWFPSFVPAHCREFGGRSNHPR